MESASDVILEIRPFAGSSGTCSDQVAFSYLNSARKLLWNKTDYPETLDYIAICCAPDCFFLPSAYKQIRLAWLGGVPTSIGDEWYVSIPQVGMPDASRSCHRKIAQIGGFHVTYREYKEGPYRIGIQAEDPNDIGQEITVFANDQYGTSRKEVITLTSPPNRALSENYYKQVTAVIKPRTAGRIRLYAVDPMANQYLLLAIYQPYDKSPQFRKYAVAGPCNQRDMTLYVKKTYFDLTSENELVEFPIEALKFAVMALVAQRDRDSQGYVTNMQLAMAELNKEMEDQYIPTASPLRLFHEDKGANLIRF